MPLNVLQVGAVPSASLGDGSNPTALAGKAGEAVITDLHGKHYTQTYRGNTFLGSTAVGGVVPPIYNNTAQTFGLWNPTGSGKNLVPIRLSIGLVTVGVVTANFVISYVTTAGSQIGTGSTISAATLVAATNLNLGNGTASIAKFAPATITTTAPALLMSTGISVFMATTPTAQNMLFPASNYDFLGQLIVAPGTAIFVAGNAAMVGTYNINLTWEEVPI